MNFRSDKRTKTKRKTKMFFSCFRKYFITDKNEEMIIDGKTCDVQNVFNDPKSTNDSKSNCVICDELLLKNQCILISCNHVFHTKCFYKSGIMDGRCPICNCIFDYICRKTI